jgi:hypothetical protein
MKGALENFIQSIEKKLNEESKDRRESNIEKLERSLICIKLEN